MQPIKLTYFNFTGLAEPIRFLLAYGQLDFLDYRIEREEFNLKKESFPMGQVPVLEIDGLTLHQSVSICRYLGQKFGITGKDLRDATLCDVMADTVNELRAGLAAFRFDPLEDARMRKKEEAMRQTEVYLNKLEAIANKNGGFLVLPNQVTWPDVMFAALSHNMSWMADKDLLHGLPTLTRLRDLVMDLPGVKEYITRRPYTER